MKKEQSPFYSLENIKKKKCIYNLIFGERSNGKSYACLEEIMKRYLATGEQGAIIRRWADDFKGGLSQQMWDNLVANGCLAESEWEGVFYQSGKFFLYKWDEKLNKRVLAPEPMCYAFALNTATRYKSTSYPKITTVLFDEFLDRNGYISGEFVDFMSIISTIVRHRTNVTIYMCGNTVTKNCPYFIEMGLTNVKNQKQGTIDVYHYGNSELTVAVEYCGSKPSEIKGSDKYFAFDNPQLQMITSGAWEMALYPHCPCTYGKKDIIFTYFIEWEGDVLQCEIINKEGDLFTFIHRKTTPYKDEDSELIFTKEISHKRNRIMRINAGGPRVSKIFSFFQKDKVFYQDNEVGEIVRSYLQFCRGQSIIKS